MRCRITMGGMRGKSVPVDYHYLLSSYIYNAIREGDEQLAREIHDSLDFKPYTFSEIANPGHVENRITLIFNREDGHLIFSTHRRDIMEALVTGVLSFGTVYVGSEMFPVQEVEILKEPEIKDRMRFKTLSPIVISPPRDVFEAGEKGELSPSDLRWYEIFNKNLKKKYLQFFGKERRGDVHVRIYNSKYKKYHSPGPVTAYKMEFEIHGDRELIKLGYQSGFGRRTAQGFGCVKEIKEK